MKIMESVIAVLGYIWIVRTALSYIHLWYVKEYRSDRMRIHLGTRQGKRILFPETKLPPKSPKTLFLAAVLCGFEAVWLIFAPLPKIFAVFVGYFCLFPFSWLLVVLLFLPTYVLHRRRISRAVSRLRAHAPMIVIGLTGSYGKTSTKEFLATILSEHLKTLKTPESKNSPIGIAETVLTGLVVDREAFVVEMGAYRPGEIAEMSAMVRPEIGIITAINAQHQDLFRSIETTKKAKFELLEGLVGRKIAVVNADNPDVVDMARWAKKIGCRIWGYGLHIDPKDPLFDERFDISSVKSSDTSLSFVIGYRGRKYRVSAPIRGEHFAANLTAAIAASVAAGISPEDAVAAAGKVSNIRKVLQISSGPNGSILIDDTFNNNPDAAVAALAFLAKYGKKKILVFQPMIELGGFARESHVRVGKTAAAVCDAVVLTNPNFSEWFKEGASAVNPEMPVVVLSGADAAQFVRSHVGPGDAVLFKGKEAAVVQMALS